jgi:hypothetical protein
MASFQVWRSRSPCMGVSWRPGGAFSLAGHLREPARVRSPTATESPDLSAWSSFSYGLSTIALELSPREVGLRGINPKIRRHDSPSIRWNRRGPNRPSIPGRGASRLRLGSVAIREEAISEWPTNPYLQELRKRRTSSRILQGQRLFPRCASSLLHHTWNTLLGLGWYPTGLQVPQVRCRE